MKKEIQTTGGILLVMLILLLSSCEKVESEIYNNNDSVLLIQVLIDSEPFYEYTYNEANYLVEEKSKSRYAKHNYAGDKLVSSDYYWDSRIWSSNSNLLDSAMNRKEWVNPSNTEKYSTKTYYYDDNEKLIKTTIQSRDCIFSYDERNRINRQDFYNSDNEKTGYFDFIYDERGNTIKKFQYRKMESGQIELRTTTEYEFDSMNNPYKSFNALMIPGLNTNTNNITKEIYTIHFEVDQTIENVQIIENIYKYNDKGYPISKNEIFEYKYQ